MTVIDLQDILAFIEKDSRVAANQLRVAVEHTASMIGARPHLGIRHRRSPERRSTLVAHYPYRLHYVMRDAEILILHIRHTARRPWQGDR